MRVLVKSHLISKLSYRQVIRDRGEITKVDDTSLGSVVRRLELRDVHNVSAHARRSDEASVGEVL